VEDDALLDGVRELEIVLTHFHLDHVVGLAYLPALGLPRAPRLHGPGRWLYDQGTAALLDRLVGPPLFVGVGQLVSDIGEIRPEGLSVGPFEIAARVQEHHTGPTLALRLGNLLTYCTDTAFDAGNVDFARGSRVLVHEAWYTEDAPSGEAITRLATAPRGSRRTPAWSASC
jgi:hypothetical protein